MGSRSNKAGARSLSFINKEGQHIGRGSRRGQKAKGQFGGKAGFRATVFKRTTKYDHPRTKRDILQVPEKKIVFLKNRSKRGSYAIK